MQTWEPFASLTTNPNRESPFWTEAKIKRTAYYISAHGYGHASRSVPVLKKLANISHVFIKSSIDFEFFNDSLEKNFEYIPQNVDAGCQHSNSLLIDTEKSFQKLHSFFENTSLREEEKWLVENKIDLVISDIASMPLKVAGNLNIPTILIGNFTWHDI